MDGEMRKFSLIDWINGTVWNFQKVTWIDRHLKNAGEHSCQNIEIVIKKDEDISLPVNNVK